MKNSIFISRTPTLGDGSLPCPTSRIPGVDSRWEIPLDPPWSRVDPGTERPLPASGPAGLLLPQAGEGEYVRPSARFLGRGLNRAEKDT